MASEDTFSSVPWTLETHGSTTLYHKSSVPYLPSANRLQNLSIWLPTKSTSLPEASAFPSSSGLWIIYVHGGAWRDPQVLASSFEPTVAALSTSHSSTLTSIAGIATINYSLSPHPNHPTDPAPPKDASQKVDESRTAMHPDHIVDVLTGLAFLQKKAGFGSNYVLLGHSCGATLAFQVAMDHQKWGTRATALQVAKPVAVVGLNGLYDMPKIIATPGEKHEYLKAAYEDFTRLAFGDDKEVWRTMCPISVEDWSEEWKEGKKLVFLQSHEDSLVPYWQTAEMKAAVEGSKSSELEIRELDAGGDHNELWQKGDRLAEIVVDVFTSLA